MIIDFLTLVCKKTEFTKFNMWEINLKVVSETYGMNFISNLEKIYNYIIQLSNNIDRENV